MTDAIAIKRDDAPAPAREQDQMLAIIERAARDENVKIEVIERMMALATEREAKASRRSFNAALAKAKAEFGPIYKRRSVDFSSAKGRTNYKFEDLAEIAAAVDPSLSKYGLSYRFRSAQEKGNLTVFCIVSHEDGHEEENSLAATEDHSGNKNNIQAIGSTATFLQRYTLKLSLGLAPAPDTDGNRQKPQEKPPELISEEQFVELSVLIRETNSDIAKFLELGGLDNLGDMKAADFAGARNMLIQKKKKLAEKAPA